MSDIIKPTSSASRRIYKELLLPMEPGDTITNEQWQAIGEYGAFETARRRLRRERGRWLLSVRGEGYRMLSAAEHEEAQERHKGRARTQVRSVIKAGDDAIRHPEELTCEQSSQYEEQNRHFKAIYRMLKQQQAQIKEVREVTSNHEDRLSRLERQIGELAGDERRAA